MKIRPIPTRLSRTSIYLGLLLVTGWFASQACFPIYLPPTPVESRPPCPPNPDGSPVCPSPVPASPSP